MQTQENVILLRYGELFLKGNNRGIFEKLVITNIKKSLTGFSFKLDKIDGRYILSNYEKQKENEIIDKVKKVFGLHSVSKATCLISSENEIINYIKTLTIKTNTFKVAVTRADKSFPKTSQEFNAICGGVILENNKNAKVDVHKPQTLVTIDIRLNKKTYVSFDKILCSGGLPVGCSGKGISLLSGGIDSPVASYLIAKRGMKLEFLHFFSYPYTSEQAKDKVVRLGKIVKEYSLSSKIYMINFAKVQEDIHKNCNGDYMILIMRRIMMSLTKLLCERNKFDAIVTGENLGQVASQTIENITTTNLNAKDTVVLRPLIGLDKDDIIAIAQKIGTFETSIEPFEDCCTVFLPKKPIIKGKLDNLLREEAKLDIQSLINNCLESMEIIEI